MGFIFMIVAGTVAGWLTAFALRPDGTLRYAQYSILCGIAGALAGGLIVAPLLGQGDLANSQYSVSALLVSILGALVALVPLNLSLRSRIR